MLADPAERTIGGRDLTQWRTALGRRLQSVVVWVSERTGLAPALVIGLAVAIGLFSGTVAVAGEIYESVVEQTRLVALDQQVLQWCLSVRSPGWDAAIAAFSNSGGPFWMPIIAGAAVLAMGLAWRSWTPVVLMLIATAGSLAMTTVGKRLFGRARPPLVDSVPPYETSASFPSGHSLNSLVIAGLLVYLLLAHVNSRWRRTALVLLTVGYVAAMGLSRVYLGHHWLSDVLMAWAIGVAWLTVVITAHRLWLSGRAEHGPVASPDDRGITP